MQWDGSQGSPVFGPTELTTSLTSGDVFRSEGLSDEAAPSALIASAMPGGLPTRDGASAYWTGFEGPSFPAAPSWNGDSMRSNSTSGFTGYSNESGNFYGTNTGMPDPFATSNWSVTVEITISLSAEPSGLYSAAHDLAPGGNMDFSSRGIFPAPFLETNNFGPEPDVLDGGDAFDFAPPAARSVVPRLETSSNEADPTFAASPSLTQTSAVSSLQIMAFPTAGGRAANGASIPTGVGFAIQVDRGSEPTGGGWTSYVIGGDWGSPVRSRLAFRLMTGSQPAAYPMMHLPPRSPTAPHHCPPS